MPQLPSKIRAAIGNKLCQIRKTKGKSIGQAATEAGVLARTLANIERGKVDFRILTLLKLCQAYNICMDKLLEDIES